MAIDTTYIPLAPAFRQDGDPTDIEVKLLDVKVPKSVNPDAGYRYTAIIQPCRVNGDFVTTAPFTWPTLRVVISYTKRRTRKATDAARTEFRRQLQAEDRSGEVWAAIQSIATPFGGIKTD